jgi:hypothetical protein
MLLRTPTCEASLAHRNFDIVPSHRNRLAPSGLAFQRCDVLAPNISSRIDILDGRGKILDLVALHHPLEILHGGVAQSLVQSPCELCTLNLSLRETFLVFRNSGS